MLIPSLALLLIAAVIGLGAWYALAQTRYPVGGAAGAYRQPVGSGGFIVAMIFLTIAGLIVLPIVLFVIVHLSW